ncbi:hypothetical protein SK128_012769 [Halocaridina rubra]|uniref:Uncharacterized protein n=1 Tax=Halocaridina rubra TaxID=373956 RepID=A0AAN8XHU6_HALRR
MVHADGIVQSTSHYVTEYYYEGNNPTFALFLAKYGKAQIYLKEFTAGLKHLEEAKAILIDAVGSQHPFIVDILNPLTLLADEDINIRLARKKQNDLRNELLKQCAVNSLLVKEKSKAPLNEQLQICLKAGQLDVTFGGELYYECSLFL